MSTYPIFAQCRDSSPTIQSAGVVSGPGANAVITSVTIPTPVMANAELYEIRVQYYVSGTITAAENNNLRVNRLPSGGSLITVHSPLLLLATGATTYFDQDFTMIVACAAGDILSIQTIGAGGASAIYSASIVARNVS